MRVGLRFESQTDKCCGKRAIILHVTLFLLLYPLLSGNIGKCTRAARMLYGSFAPTSVTN